MEVVYNSDDVNSGVGSGEDVNTTVAKNFYSITHVMSNYRNYTPDEIKDAVNIGYGLLNLCERLDRDVILVSPNSPVYNNYRDAGIPHNLLMENTARYFPVVNPSELGKVLLGHISVLKFLEYFTRYGVDDMLITRLFSNFVLWSTGDVNAALHSIYQQDFHFPVEVRANFNFLFLNSSEIDRRLSNIRRKGYPNSENFNWFKNMISNYLYFDFVFRYSGTKINIERVSNYYI
uniref:p27 n=1 Tax=Tomato chlorosis virus TaxID=67754 RepID=U5NIT8_9CLOS|nr:p27 [Tomato chlorosis virus]